MVRLKQFATLIAASAILLAAVPAASADVIHTYAVTLTISVDRSADRLSGTVTSDAPSEFCDSRNGRRSATTT